MSDDQKPERLLLKVGDVMELLQVSRQTLHTWTQRGFMPTPIRIGDGPRAAIRWGKEELEDWVRSGGVRLMERCDRAKALRDEANRQGIKAAFFVSGACDEPHLLEPDEYYATESEVENELKA